MRGDKWPVWRVFIALLLPWVLLAGRFASPVWAADLLSGASLSSNALASVPPVLHSWVGGVLRDRPDRGCPVNYAALDQRQYGLAVRVVAAFAESEGRRVVTLAVSFTGKLGRRDTKGIAPTVDLLRGIAVARLTVPMIEPVI